MNEYIVIEEVGLITKDAWASLDKGDIIEKYPHIIIPQTCANKIKEEDLSPIERQLRKPGLKKVECVLVAWG